MYTVFYSQGFFSDGWYLPPYCRAIHSRPTQYISTRPVRIGEREHWSEIPSLSLYLVWDVHDPSFLSFSWDKECLLCCAVLCWAVLSRPSPENVMQQRGVCGFLCISWWWWQRRGAVGFGVSVAFLQVFLLNQRCFTSKCDSAAWPLTHRFIRGSYLKNAYEDAVAWGPPDDGPMLLPRSPQ